MFEPSNTSLPGGLILVPTLVSPSRRVFPVQVVNLSPEDLCLLPKMKLRILGSSSYASPVVLVLKSDGSLRLCMDYRKLNSKNNAFLLPQIDESLDALSRAKVFSSINLASGYKQVAVREKDQHKTAFVTPFGLYEYQQMLFGLSNVHTTVQRLMQAVMGDLVF